MAPCGGRKNREEPETLTQKHRCSHSYLGDGIKRTTRSRLWWLKCDALSIERNDDYASLERFQDTAQRRNCSAIS